MKLLLTPDDKALEALERLQRATGADSLVSVLRDALGVYDALQSMIAAGKTIVVVDGGVANELIMPTLVPERLLRL